MVNPGFGRWALAIVVIALILALVVAATVVMASAILQPEINPVIQVQPQVVKPGDIVVVTGRGWPGLTDTAIVIALSPTRDLATAGLLPVAAVRVDLSGRLAATFVYPADVPWTAVREVWVVARPPSGNLQAAAHLAVQRLAPTATPTPALAQTPLVAQQQVQGTIVNLAPDLGLMVVSPFDGGAQRGIGFAAASIQFADGSSATPADLQVGLTVAAWGWFDSAGTLVAERIMILEARVPILVPPGATPAPTVVAVAAPAPLLVCTPLPTLCPIVLPAVPICTPVPPVCGTATPTPEGLDTWQGEFWPNPWFMGPPVLVRRYRVIDFNWREGAPAAELPAMGYGVRWTGTFLFRAGCRYRFLLLLKGNARFWVDGQLLIDQWNDPLPAEYPAEVALAQGPHVLKLEYRNLGSPARVQLRWEQVGTVLGDGL